MSLRKTVFALSVFVLLCGNTFAFRVDSMPLEQRKAYVNLPGMCSIEPAGRWDQGIVTGNGVMGASVLGQPYQEKIIFNHERLFRPILEARPQPPVISGALPEVRRLMKEGKTNQALNYWREVMAENGHPKIVNTPSYHPAYSMQVVRQDAGNVRDYLRTVDFMTGEAIVRFRNEAGSWINKTFVSRADNVIVQLFESLDGKAFNLELKLEDQWQKRTDDMETISTSYDAEWMIARAQYRLTKRGYEGASRIIYDGGVTRASEDGIICSQVTRVLILTRIVDLDDFADSELAVIKDSLVQLATDYETLLRPHVQLHGKAMERMTIHLDQSDKRYLSSEELIAEQAQSTVIIPAFLEKMFNMGRYALLASSGNYPPPLTGIWNGNQRPAWSGDWTLDTNLNQQIASANTCALPEALEAYLKLIEEIAPTWEINAKNIYGFRGHLSGFRTAGRENYHTHFGKFPGHCWTAGAAWLIYPLYEYYLVTGDQAFLKNRVLPLMEKTVLFLEDFLTELDDQGNYLFVPSYSPEHLPMQSMNAVQDIAAAKQAVRTLIEAYTDLGIESERVAQLQAMLGRMPPYLINDSGAFQEWAYPGYKEHNDHRHLSHSYPVWPAHELNWEDDATYVQAMRIALELRMPQEWSGHAFAVRALCAARTKYPSLFYQNLYTLMRYDYIERNLVTRHNPGWAPNTDVLCGLPGLISEGLVYSKPGVIELLPAWSRDMPAGSITGIRCRTQATVDTLQWDVERKTVSATMTSLKDQWVTLYMRQGIQELKTNGQVKSSVHGDIAREIFLPKGVPVQVRVHLKQFENDYPVNVPAFTYDAAAKAHVERMLKKTNQSK